MTKGLCMRGLTDEGLSAAVGLVASAGFDSLLVAEIFDLSADLDVRQLSDARDTAHDAGVRLTVGLPYLHPHRIADDGGLLRAGDGDAGRGLRRALEAVAGFDDADVPFVLGYVEDRLSPDVSWRVQLDDTADLIARTAPLLRDLGLRLCIKTHEEITTFEIVELVERVGADVLSVGFDPVNSLLRWEDPVAAAERIAPYVVNVYVDDATFTAEGAAWRRWLCPVGAGVLDWPAIAVALQARAPRYWVDLHRGQFTLEPEAPDLARQHPDLTAAEFDSVLECARAADRRWPASAISSLRAGQSAPRDRLPAAIRAVTELSALGRAPG